MLLMKKLRRNPEKFGALDLFADMAVEHGYCLDDAQAQDDFVSRIRQSLSNGKRSDTTIYGKRVESLFAYVVGALGEVALLKQEDSGDIFYSGDEVIAPDYRATFKNHEQLLVEVKNCHHKNPKERFVIKKAYVEKLQRYAEINGVDLRIAVYFSSWNIWTLLSLSSFKESDKNYSIDIIRAMACTEMSVLGDCTVCTTPDLEIHLLADANEAEEIDVSGQAKFVTRDVKFYCSGNEILDEKEKEIAFYLIRFGRWVEKEAEAVVKNNKLLMVKFVYAPESQDNPDFSPVGNLSGMVTNAFGELTVKNGDVVALKLGVDPSTFRVLIPADYKGKRLPLWRFVIQANPDFQNDARTTNS